MTLPTSETPKILAAISLAARAHQGQLRKDRVTPYVGHVFRVCFIVRHVFQVVEEEVLLSAVLHDIVEDTTNDFDDLEELFGMQVANWVAQLSKDKRLPFAEREKQYEAVLTRACWQVQICKLADIYDNLLDSTHLAAESRARSLANAERYLRALKAGLKPESQSALAIVEALLESTVH